MTEKEYRASDGVSRSELWKMRASPEKFKYFRDHKEEPSPALIFGSFVHKLLLEPLTVDDEYAIAPKVDRRTKDGKAAWAAFCEANEGKEVISCEDAKTAAEMVEACLRTPYVQELLFAGEHEKPFFWTDADTGELCKVRVDCLTELPSGLTIIDYKTTTNADTDSFARSAVNYGYDFQAAMYSEAVKEATGRDVDFIFIAQEKEPPYSVNVMRMSQEFIDHGRAIFRDLIQRYHDCKRRDDWYGYLGYYGMINELNLPAWVRNDI